MAERRKLQGEIERCFKKVSEGVEQFEEIWQKVYNATNANQKEKYEADLKKEIKKLQRLRDQIKTWTASSDIKDKTALCDKRKLIEAQMERFKALEHEMKTKAYSNQGLDSAQKIDEKEEITMWLSTSINTLSIHMDQFESELESLAVKRNADSQERIDELKTLLSRHRYHMQHLETIMRMLDNETVQACEVIKIKEDVRHYIDSCEDPEFKENEFIYDDLDFGNVAYFGTSTFPEQEHVPDCNLNAASPSEDTAVKEMTASTNSCSLASKPAPTSHSRHGERSRKVKRARSGVAHETSVANKTRAPITFRSKSASCSSRRNVSSSLRSPRNPAPCRIPYAAAAGSNTDWTRFLPRLSTGAPFTGRPTGQTDHSTLASLQAPQQRKRTPTTTTANRGSQKDVRKWSVLKNDSGAEPSAFLRVPSGSEEDWPSLPLASSLPRRNDQLTGSGADSTSLKPKSNQGNAGVEDPAQSMPSEQQLQQQQQQAHCSWDEGGFASGGSGNHMLRPQSGATLEAAMPPIRGVFPAESTPLSDECCYQLRLLEAASKHLPLPQDSAPYRPSIQRAPVVAPSYYPQNICHCEKVNFCERLSAETLFFMFYVMAGTKAQYLAAKALKQQVWRYHTKYRTWFQRLEEPKTMTEEYEIGTYVYFDYANWSQRRRKDLIFEYKYLEDLHPN